MPAVPEARKNLGKDGLRLPTCPHRRAVRKEESVRKTSEVTTQTYVCRVLGRQVIVGKPRVARAVEVLSGKHLALAPA